MSMGAPATLNRTPALVAMISGAVLAISSFLEWVSVEVTPGFKVSASGMDGSDGWITLVSGVVGVVAGAMAYSAGPKGKLPGILAIVAGIIGLGVGLIDYADADGYQSYGLYLVILGGLGTLVGGIMLLRSRTAPDTTTTTTDVPPGGTPTV
jgi:hypothetical protein